MRLVESGRSYTDVSRRLGIHPGLAYLIATGLPADGGDTLTAADEERPGFVAGSTQQLANSSTKAENPTRKEHVLRWVKARAADDAQMAQAAAARTAEPEPERPGEEEEFGILAVLTRDHDHVTALVQQLSAIPGHKKGGSPTQIDRRQSIVDVITVALAQHESVEEEYFWPSVRRVLDDGDDVAATGLAQEQQGNEVLDALAHADPDSDEFDGLVERLIMLLRKHVSFEDRVVLRLHEAMPPDERAQLGQKFLRAKKAAPTRAHPHAPRHSSASAKAAGMPAAAMDTMRDAVGSRPAQRKGKADSKTQEDA